MRERLQAFSVQKYGKIETALFIWAIVPFSFSVEHQLFFWFHSFQFIILIKNQKCYVWWMLQALNTRQTTVAMFIFQFAHTSVYAMLSSLFMLILKFFHTIHTGVLYNYSHTEKQEVEWVDGLYCSSLHIPCAVSFTFNSASQYHLNRTHMRTRALSQHKMNAPGSWV